MIEDKSVQLRKKTRLKSKFHRYSLNLFASKGTAEKSRILKMSSSREQLNKVQTEENYLSSYVNVSFVHDDEIRRKSIELFYQMINHEIEHTSNIEHFEKEFLNIASVLIVSGGKCDVRYISLFQKLLHEWIAKNQKNNEKKIVFDNLIKRLSCGMKILLEYRDCDKNDEFAQISCLINLAQFFQRCNRLDLYRNYLFKLYELQVSLQAKIEAALALKKIGDSLQFEHVAFSEEWSRTCYPQAITEAEVKELLTSESIDALDEARLRHHAIEQVKVLEGYYDQVANFEQLGDVLKIRAQLTQRMTSNDDLGYSYFYVGYWGKSFPASVQNTAFVHRGAELERFEDFCARLKKRFPKAEILNYAKTINDELKDQSGQKIQVYPIKPIITSDQYSTHHFEHLRSFKNDKDDSTHAIERRWVEQRIFTVTDSFPSISSSNRVINVKSTNLSPIEVACSGILEKSAKLREMIQSHMKNNDRDISQLGMILQGIIEPRVNGGYKVYETTFLSSQSNYDQSDQNKLLDALSNQIPLLERLLLIHEHQITSDLMPFHKSLEKSFQTMKRQFQDKYDRVDTFTTSNPIRCLRRLSNDPEGTSIASSSSLRNQSETTSNGTQGLMSLSKRSRPISWMESSNTLASVSNYGGSECSLADRGRRSSRRSKPKEWLQSLIGSTSRLNQKENKEIILKEQVTPTRPRRPTSIPRSPNVSKTATPKKEQPHVPVIKNPLSSSSRQSQV